MCSVQAQPVEEIPYRVVTDEHFSGMVRGSSAYDDMEWGSFDREQMPEIHPSGIQAPPEPVVIHYSEPEEPFVVEITLEEVALQDPQQRASAARGEDLVFRQIYDDLYMQRCFLMQDEDCDPMTGLRGITLGPEEAEAMAAELAAAAEAEPEEEAPPEEDTSWLPQLNELFFSGMRVELEE
ncbi:hypothetical protein [Nitrincola sp. MINF-07-Sa-05]|uniref:hypothetical protein n=1 Tax=Nitrincola salilacus TaxID=3400273 RepID=UPI003917C838